MEKGKRHHCDCVVKLGGAAITRKGNLETLDHEVLKAVVEHIRLVKEEQGGKKINGEKKNQKKTPPPPPLQCAGLR